jgi:O-antigen/teichoic acid export membrane protein
MSEIQKYKFFSDSLIKNSIYLMATSFVTSGIGFFFWIIAARYYSPNDIGITSAIFSSISLISMIGSLGLSRALIFYLPRDKNTGKIISSCLTIGIISSITFSLIFMLGLKIWSPELALTLNNIDKILIFIIITTAISVSGLIGAAFTAGKRSSFQMIKETTYHFFKLCPLIFFVGFGAMGILISIGIGLTFSLMIGFILLFKVWKYSPKLTLDPIINKMARFSAGNYIAGIFNTLPTLVLPIMILNIIGAKSAGYFYIAIMMAGLLYGISQSIASSFLVESSDKDKFWNNVNKSIKFNMIVLVPGLLLFIIFGKFILNIFNPSYAENATMTMIILTIASVPLSLVNIFTTVRNAQNRVSSMIKMNIIVATITIALSIPLIKIMNIEGVAISYLIANTIGAIIVINRIKNPKEFSLKLLKDIKKDIG